MKARSKQAARPSVIGELQAMHATLKLVASNTAPEIVVADVPPFLRKSQIPPKLPPGRDLLVPTTIKIGADGNRMAHTAKGHVAVLLPDIHSDGSGLMFDARKPQKGSNWQAAKDMGAAVNLFGRNDWQLATRAQLALLVDDDQTRPACNPAMFPEMPHDDWCWTRTPLASSPSGYAWLVHFSGGSVNWSYQGNSGFVVACRRVPAGQF